MGITSPLIFSSKLVVVLVVLCTFFTKHSLTNGHFGSGGGGTGLDEYIARLRRKFDQKFQKTCLKYPFVQKHIELLENPPGKYVMFVVQEPGQLAGLTGGLGDRLSGLITAAAYSIRINRTLLVVGEAPFEDLFVPYYVPSSSAQPPRNFTYKDWSWSNFDQKYTKDMHWERCVNPKKNHIACALDYDYFHDTIALKFYCNRTYLCRWLVEKQLGLGNEIKRILGIDESADLYEIAGCLLRLAIHPTELMWKSLKKLVKESNVRNVNLDIVNDHDQHRRTAGVSKKDINTKVENKPDEELSKNEQLLIGIHFRCGDSSFHINDNTPPNPQCVYISNTTWKGTSFRDDLSLDSPLDLAVCANNLATLHGAGVVTAHQQPVLPPPPVNGSHHSHFDHNVLFKNVNHKHVVYIASDNIQSTQQIISRLFFKNILNQPKSCHVDEDGHALDCATSTLTQWFLLSLSDYIITQGVDSAMPTAYEDIPERMQEFQKGIAKPKFPISAFSRTAVVYSLDSDNVRFGAGCTTMNEAIGHFSHGNWICLPHMFY